MISFPPELPYPELQGYGFKPESTFMRTKMQSGRSKARRIYENAPELCTLDWDFNSRELMLFELWYRHGINDGVSPFLCKLKTPMGMRDVQVSVVNIYTKYAVSARDWRVKMDCEIKERETLPANYLEFPEFILNMHIIDKAIND